jgi:hypothetical protein
MTTSVTTIGVGTPTIKTLISSIRQWIGVASSQSISDEQIINDINYIWQYKIPFKQSMADFVDTFSFMTSQGFDSYTMPSNIAISKQSTYISIDNIPVKLLYNPNAFRQLFGIRNNQQIFNQVSGTSFSYSAGGYIARGNIDPLGNVTPMVIISTIDSTNTPVNLFDCGTGLLYLQTGGSMGVLVAGALGTPVGTVDYSSGEIAFTIPNGVENANIYANIDTTSWTRPTMALYYNNMIKLRPVPNQPYLVLIQVNYVGGSFLANTDVLPYPQWAEYLIIATSRRIAERFLDSMRAPVLEAHEEEILSGMQDLDYKNSGIMFPPTQWNRPSMNMPTGVFINPFGFSPSDPVS